MTNFGNIGFPVSSPDELQKLLKHVIPYGIDYYVDNGKYVCFHDYSGAEIWIQIVNDKIIGFNPHFSGKSCFRVNLLERLEDQNSPLDGKFYCESIASDSEVNYPFVFLVPDYQCQKKVEINNQVNIQITAFPISISIYKNEKKYLSSQPFEFKMAVKSFIPSGLFLPGGIKREIKQEIGIFSGIIIDYKLLKNQITLEKYYWILCETINGEIDIVVDKNEIVKPVVNGIVSGQYWLSARIVN